MKYVGFYKKTRNPSRARQEHILAPYALWAIVEDDADEAVKMMRQGRALVVAQLGLLGRVGPQLQGIISRVHERGGYIIEAATERQSCDPVDAAAMGMDALQRKKITREQAAANARQYDDDVFKAALAKWKSGVKRQEIADDIGVSLSTLVRRMRAVGAKPRKGGRPPVK